MVCLGRHVLYEQSICQHRHNYINGLQDAGYHMISPIAQKSSNLHTFGGFKLTQFCIDIRDHSLLSLW